jgi:hypothetical protein
MQKLMRVATPILAAAALALLSVQPAYAAAGGTGTTFTITGGALTIAVPGSADLGSQAAGITALTATGSLGDVTVSDARGTVAGWTTTALSTAFNSGGNSVPASAVNYVGGAATTTGIVAVVPVAATGLDTAKTVATAVSTGVNTAKWNPVISVLLPAGTVVGTYTATITHSVV